MLKTHTFLVFLGCLILLSACQYTQEKYSDVDRTPPMFMNVAAEAGISFQNDLTSSEHFNMIDYLYYYDGGGVAVGDINNDGFDDIYFVANEGGNALYLNLGEFKFQDITESAGVASPGLWKTGVSFVDINEDGFLDIYLCRLGDYKGVEGSNELYINQGDLTFVESAREYGLDFSGFSTQASFFDADGDSDLDLYLLNHSVHSRRRIGGIEFREFVDSLSGDRIYENKSRVFDDVTNGSGIYQSALGYGLGISTNDVNGDGLIDIVVANDFLENDYLYLNKGGFKFEEVFSAKATGTSLSSMGIDVADINNDGLPDIVIADMLPPLGPLRDQIVGEDPLEIFDMKHQMGYMPQYNRNTLHLNRGDAFFSEIGRLAGIHSTDWSWSPLIADFDNDGLKDLFISNGILGRPNDKEYLEFISRPDIANANIPDSILILRMPNGAASNAFFKNINGLQFEDRTNIWIGNEKTISSGSAYSDLDNDGDLDLIVNNVNSEALVLENKNSTENAFLEVNVIGSNANKKSIGAIVEVYFNDGQYQQQVVSPVKGFKSSSSFRVHFGFGNSTSIDSLVVTWADRTLGRILSPKINSILRIEYGSNSSQKLKENDLAELSISELDLEAVGLDYIHQENTFNEFTREPLLHHMQSTEGPAMAVGDVNGDGMDDIYLGGARNQPGTFYFQTDSGFEEMLMPIFGQDKATEDVDAKFFDYDNDGDLDLIVVSGGNEFVGESANRVPRLYLNSGTGDFDKAHNLFDNQFQNASVVTLLDFDNDGWTDIFLGALSVPWNYGLSPKSYLMRNDSGNGFIDSSAILPDDGELGMVSDAIWVDVNKDGKKVLILCGEWSGIKFIDLEESELNELEKSTGLWQTIEIEDVNKDGLNDILVGNLGLNSNLQMENSPRLWLGDFDSNGKLDPILLHEIDDELRFISGYEDLTKQFPNLSRAYPTAHAFSIASVDEVLGNKHDEIRRIQLDELRSGVFINSPKGFRFEPFPLEAQFSIIQDFHLFDFNKDGITDLLSVGNRKKNAIWEGQLSSDFGSILIGTDSGFRYVPNNMTGMYLLGDMRFIEELKVGDSKSLIIARNNDNPIAITVDE